MIIDFNVCNRAYALRSQTKSTRLTQLRNYLLGNMWLFNDKAILLCKHLG